MVDFLRKILLAGTYSCIAQKNEASLATKQLRLYVSGVVIFFDRGSALQFFGAIFVALIFLVFDTFTRPFHDFRCNALKSLMSLSMVITLLCGLCSKLDPEETVIGDGTLGWTLVISNFLIVLIIGCLELIRRLVSVFRGVRSGISYVPNTKVVCSVSGNKSYDGEFRSSAEDKPVVATVYAYPSHIFPDARVVHSRIAEMGKTAHIQQIFSTQVEKGVLYVAAKSYGSTLSGHVEIFQTCPISAEEFCKAIISGVATLHGMNIMHGDVRPHAIMLDSGTIVLSDFSNAKTVDDDVDGAIKIDAKMLACTILYTLSGGLTGDLEKLEYSSVMIAADNNFEDESIFDRIKAAKPELKDLLRQMIAGTALPDLLDRPYFWSHEKVTAYLGEEIGNLLDPSAGKDSGQWEFLEALEAAGDTALGGSYDEALKQDGASWAALMDDDFPLTKGLDASDPTGWGSSRSAQQAPADVEHCYAVYGKNPSAKQKVARVGHLKSGKKMPMANRRMVGLLKTIRNVAFAHRSQHVQFGRFDTEEDVMRYMVDPRARSFVVE